MHNSDRVKKLKKDLLTGRRIGTTDIGDNWDVPIFNMNERLEAADELVKIKGKDALSDIMVFFGQLVCDLNTSYDADIHGTHHMSYPSELRRIANLIISIGGADSLATTLSQHVFENAVKSVHPSTSYSDTWIKSEKLTYVYNNFGSIKDLKEKLYITSGCSDDNNSVQRTIAITTLALLGDKRGVAMLANALNDREYNLLKSNAQDYFKKYPKKKTTLEKKWWQFWK